MKKYLFFAAAVAITACTNDTLIDDTKVPDTKEVAIGFGSDLNKMTRAENSTGELGEGLENYHQTMRIWGYKNIKNNGADTYKSTPVFDATNTADLYANSVATWSVYASNDDPFNKVGTSFGGGDWVYSPVRYWDKTATNYDFHAAAPDKDFASTPASIAWVWNQTMADASTWDKDAADGKGAGYFTLGTHTTGATATGSGFTLAGESLPINSAVATQTYDVFGKGTTKDVDLMIADDVNTENPLLHTSTNNPRVDFRFNHILSRLNIGVKTTVTHVPAVAASGTPETGKVILESVKVFNLKNSGAFDESLVSGEDLAKGTANRWVKGEPTYNNGAATPTTVGIGYPNTEVPAITSITPNGLLISDKIEEDAVSTDSPEMLAIDYKYVFQGLIIPQKVEWKKLAIDGSDVDTDKDIYLEIKYNIDGEDFTAVYNLADVFTANIQYKDSKDHAAVKETVNGHIFTDGTSFYTKDSGDALSNDLIAKFDGTNYYAVNGTTQIYLKDGYFYEDEDFNTQLTNQPQYFVVCTNTGTATTLTPVPAMRAEVGTDAEKSITFCEGWQNNLKINISPVAILFDAEVYKWADKEDATVTVE